MKRPRAIVTSCASTAFLLGVVFIGSFLLSRRQGAQDTFGMSFSFVVRRMKEPQRNALGHVVLSSLPVPRPECPGRVVAFVVLLAVGLPGVPELSFLASDPSLHGFAHNILTVKGRLPSICRRMKQAGACASACRSIIVVRNVLFHGSHSLHWDNRRMKKPRHWGAVQGGLIVLQSRGQ